MTKCKRYLNELKLEILHLLQDKSMSVAEISRKYEIAKGTICNWKKIPDKIREAAYDKIQP